MSECGALNLQGPCSARQPELCYVRPAVGPAVSMHRGKCENGYVHTYGSRGWRQIYSNSCRERRISRAASQRVADLRR